jgi:release factor glutamine methyltransferase
MPQSKMSHSIEQLLTSARTLLDDTSASAGIDAEILLCHTLGCSRSHLFAWPQKTLTAEQIDRYHELVDLRASGRPVAYLTGAREFWSLPLKVDESTLIPRPETETLIEFVLERFAADTVLDVADLGTGSGAIACALASERPHWSIVATDVSHAALNVARDNARRLGLDTIRFAHGDWFDAFDAARRFDLLVSNPPYVAAADPHLSSGDVMFEPASALVSGADGLDDIRRIAAQATDRLKTGGWLVLEHGYNQQPVVAAILRNAGFDSIELRRDLAGIPRMTAGCRSDA